MSFLLVLGDLDLDLDFSLIFFGETDDFDLDFDFLSVVLGTGGELDFDFDFLSVFLGDGDLDFEADFPLDFLTSFTDSSSELPEFPLSFGSGLFSSFPFPEKVG